MDSEAFVTPSSSGRVTMDSFHAIVNAVAAAPPSQLSPMLLHQLPRALAACQSAITLRERVAQFFTSNNKASVQEDTHAHFLNRLKTWLWILKPVEVAALSNLKNTANSKKAKPASGGNAVVADDLGDRSRFTNYYEVLRIPDDFFPESADDTTSVLSDASAVAASVASAASGVSAAERKQLFDAEFEEDLHMELVCYMIEMEDLVEQVYATYHEVKQEKRSLVEATAVVYAAIQFTQSRVSELQLRYPSITVADDVITLLQPRIPEELSMKLADVQARAMVSQKAEHIPGLFLAEFIWVISALKTFISAVPTDKSRTLILRDRHFGDNYDEEFTPHYVAPETGNYLTFLLQQLPLLYNTLVVKKSAGGPNDSSSLPGRFFVLMTQFFDTQLVSVPIVFACVCWIKSTWRCKGLAVSLAKWAWLSPGHERLKSG